MSRRLAAATGVLALLLVAWFRSSRPPPPPGWPELSARLRGYLAAGVLELEARPEGVTITHWRAVSGGREVVSTHVSAVTPGGAVRVAEADREVVGYSVTDVAKAREKLGLRDLGGGRYAFDLGGRTVAADRPAGHVPAPRTRQVLEPFPIEWCYPPDEAARAREEAGLNAGDAAPAGR